MLKMPFFFRPMESAIAILQDNIFGGSDGKYWGHGIAELAVGASQSPAHPIHQERRREPRFILSLPVHHRIKGEKTNWKETKTLDISQNGIRLAFEAAVGVGTHLELHLKLPNLKKMIKMEGVVVWEKPSVNGQSTECGVAFENLRRISTKAKVINFMADRLCNMAMKENYALTCRPAENEQDLQKAYGLVYKEYIGRGYCKPNNAGLHYTHYCLLPESRTFLLEEKSQLVGTVSILVDTPCGIPMETLFKDRIQAFRRPGRKIAEVSLLALDHEVFGKKSFALTDFKKLSGSFMLFKQLFDYARLYAGVTDLFIAMHPRHKELYQHLTFEVLGPARNYAGAQGNPALPMHLDIPRVLLTMPRDLSLTRFFIEQSTSAEILTKRFQWPKEKIKEYLFDLREIWSHLSEKDQQYFVEAFPGFCDIL